jgi:hypothetical protein
MPSRLSNLVFINSNGSTSRHTEEGPSAKAWNSGAGRVHASRNQHRAFWHRRSGRIESKIFRVKNTIEMSVDLSPSKLGSGMGL